VVARKMVESKTHGAIVNISSQASKVGAKKNNSLLSKIIN
jgi:short-subunit dehydrogenase